MCVCGGGSWVGCEQGAGWLLPVSEQQQELRVAPPAGLGARQERSAREAVLGLGSQQGAAFPRRGAQAGLGARCAEQSTRVAHVASSDPFVPDCH